VNANVHCLSLVWTSNAILGQLCMTYEWKSLSAKINWWIGWVVASL
jgi:hypothetical protein